MTTILSQTQPMPIELKVILWIFLGALIIAHAVVLLDVCGVKIDNHFVGESFKMILPFIFIYLLIGFIFYSAYRRFKPAKQPEKDNLNTNPYDFFNGKD